MDWIERNGAGIRYDLAGDGPATVVLIHEMGGTLESWDDVVSRLAIRAAVLRLDLRGAGLSTKLRGAGSIDDMTGDVAGLLDATGRNGPALVVGIAVGGGVALRFAARHRDRVQGVMAFGPATGIPAERRQGVLDHADRVEQGGMASALESDFHRAYPEALRSDGARFAAARARWLGNDPGSYAAIYRMLAHLDLGADLAAIACPALLLAGRHDPLRPAETVAPVAATIPGGRFEPIESGHYAAVQTPDLVADRIARFLDALDAPARAPGHAG